MSTNGSSKSIGQLARWLSNRLRYGIGESGRQRKKAAKAERRRARFEDVERWQGDGALIQRRYDSYDDYVSHQRSKLAKVEDRLNENVEADQAEFRRRFELCAPLREARTVLCLAARLGTEVKALHELGHFAVGIDLNPGENNAFVLSGDFHNLVFPDGSVDAVYTNSLDHAFALDKVTAEVARVLRPGGLFIVDALDGFEEDFVPGEYESMAWRNRDAFIEQITASGALAVESVTDMGKLRRDHWTQIVFRNKAEAASRAA